jgi:hypothetical protein
LPSGGSTMFTACTMPCRRCCIAASRPVGVNATLVGQFDLMLSLACTTALPRSSSKALC